MAWYTIEHVCGHTSQRQITGRNSRGERDRAAARCARDECPDCLAAERSRQSAAADLAAALDWPALTGSKNQIAWAQRLRADAIGELDQICRDQGLPEERHTWAREVLLAQTSAPQWINYRGGRPGGDLLHGLLNLTIWVPAPQLVMRWAADPDEPLAEAFLTAANETQRDNPR